VIFEVAIIIGNFLLLPCLFVWFGWKVGLVILLFYLGFHLRIDVALRQLDDRFDRLRRLHDQ
jgi:hypothetical protein